MLLWHVLSLAGAVSGLPNVVPRQWIGEVPIPDKCSVEDNFRDELIGSSYSEARFFWNQAIEAESYLKDWLDRKGKKDWAGRMLGSTVSCDTSFPETSNCGLPSRGSCDKYESPEVYYIHIAVANFVSTFGRWHEELQTKAIESIGSEIDGMVDYWGATGYDASQLLGVIGGAIGGAAGFVSGPLAPIMGQAGMLFGLAASAADDSLTDDPVDEVNKEISKSFTEMFKRLDTALKDTVKDVLKGHDDISVVETLGDGRFISALVVEKMADEWIETSKKMMEQSVLVNIWQTRKVETGQRKGVPAYKLRRIGSDEEKCKSGPGPKIWKGPIEGFSTGRCFGFGWSDNSGFRGRPRTRWFNQEEIDAAKKIIGSDSDMQKALQNAYDCWESGGKPGEGDTSVPVALEAGSGAWPECFFNLHGPSS